MRRPFSKIDSFFFFNTVHSITLWITCTCPDHRLLRTLEFSICSQFQSLICPFCPELAATAMLDVVWSGWRKQSICKGFGNRKCVPMWLLLSWFGASHFPLMCQLSTSGPLLLANLLCSFLPTNELELFSSHLDHCLRFCIQGLIQASETDPP